MTLNENPCKISFCKVYSLSGPIIVISWQKISLFGDIGFINTEVTSLSNPLIMKRKYSDGFS